MIKDWINEANQKKFEHKEILSFEDYMDLLSDHFLREVRPSCLYLKELFDYYGKNDDGTFQVFTREHPETRPVYGQKVVQEEIYENLLNFTEEGFNNKLILLAGPNGSSKSSLIKRIMQAAEDYSQTDEGALYQFSWIFPIEAYTKGHLGLSQKSEVKAAESYAHLEDKEISAILPSELKDHPLLLIPKEFRQKLIEVHLMDFQDRLETIKKSYLYHGDVSKRNRMIYDALLLNYKGDHKEVLKHIRVERFFISKRYSQSAVTIEPQMHVDAQMQQITMDRRLSSLPPSLQSLNLFSSSGEIIMANRGVLEFSDLLKRPLDAFKYLLMTMETRTINLKGILTELDIFFLGSSNEVHLVAFKQHPDFNSFKGRMNFIKVPYLLNYLDEKRIYSEQIHNLKDRSQFEHYALDALCLFVVMGRLRRPQEKNYDSPRQGKIVTSLDPLEKAIFLARSKAPSRLESDEKQTLAQIKDELLTEFEHDPLYEGKFGASPRIVKQMIYDIATDHSHVTFVEVIEYLKAFVERKNEFDFLNIPAQGPYHNPEKFISSIQTFCLDRLDSEVRESLGLVDDRSYESYIGKYIQNINALIKKEKILNAVTGRSDYADEYFIKEFESNISIKESPEKFRSHILSKLGAYSLDHPGTKIIYTEVFPDLTSALQNSFIEKQKKILYRISKKLVFYLQNQDNPEKSSSLSKQDITEIQGLLAKMQEKFSYSERGAISLLQFLLKERY